MSEQTSNSETLTQYLIGSLPEAEAERLAELSITDPAFAEALTVAEKDLIDAYVQGELEASVLERFKSHYLASPLRREKVRFAEAFQVFAGRSAAADAAAIDPVRRDAKRKRAGWPATLSLFTPGLAWQWGLAAVAVIMLIASGWLAIENLRLRQQTSQAEARRDELLQRERELQKEVDAERSTNSAAEQELARLRSERERLEQELEKAKSGRTTSSPVEGGVFSFNLAPPLRGAGQLPTVSVPSGTRLVSIQLQLEANDYSAYRVVLIGPARNQTLWRSSKLKAKTTREGKGLSVSFSAGLLNPQTVYLLRVAGIATNGADEVISDYSFRVGK
jgi:anti-sigma factor RsiW